MCRKPMMFSLILILLFSCTPAMASGSTNTRLLGFGGAGVAVVPLKGQTAMAINPAAPGFMKHRQINFNLDYGTGERTTHWTGVTEDPLNTDATRFGAGGEFYFPLGPVNLFFGLGSEIDSIESEGTKWQHYYHQALEEISSLSVRPHLGLAGSFNDTVSVGGQLLFWHSDVEHETGPLDFNYDTQLLAGELGVLVATPIELNFGLTYSTEDGEAYRDEIQYGQASYAHDYFFGMQSRIRMGAAYQKKDGSWLAGVEYVLVEDLELAFGRNEDYTYTFPEENLVNVYGEYWFDRLGIRGGIGRRVKEDPSYDYDIWVDYVSPVDYESWLLSLGCTYKKTDNVGFDFLLQRIDGDGASRISTFDDHYWRLGFGMTFLI